MNWEGGGIDFYDLFLPRVTGIQMPGRRILPYLVKLSVVTAMELNLWENCAAPQARTRSTHSYQCLHTLYTADYMGGALGRPTATLLLLLLLTTLVLFATLVLLLITTLLYTTVT
jgi:hypothetical protein